MPAQACVRSRDRGLPSRGPTGTPFADQPGDRHEPDLRARTSGTTQPTPAQYASVPADRQRRRSIRPRRSPSQDARQAHATMAARVRRPEHRGSQHARPHPARAERTGHHVHQVRSDAEHAAGSGRAGCGGRVDAPAKPDAARSVRRGGGDDSEGARKSARDPVRFVRADAVCISLDRAGAPRPSAQRRERRRQGSEGRQEQTENLSLPTQLRACEVLPPPGLRDPRTLPRRRRERQDHGPQPAPGAAEVLPHAQGQGSLRGRLQPHAIRAARNTTTSRCVAPEIAGHLAAVGDRADRRHIHRQVDGRRAGVVRAVRQRRAVGSHPRRDEGRPGTGTMDVPRADRLHQRSKDVRKEPHTRPRASSDCPADFSRLRHRTIHEARAVGRNDPPRAEDAKGPACQRLRRSAPCCRTSCTSASWTRPAMVSSESAETSIL